MSPPPSFDAVPGWYGKLSMLGDFAHRRLPPEWLRACEAWLAQAMPGARAALGDHWLAVYLNAPLLRFGWAPGVVDRRWWFGLLMPSCDAVGRYYPLLIAHPRDQAPRDRIALDHLDRWFEHLAQAAVQTLDDRGGSVDALESALQAAPAWPTPGRASALATEGQEPTTRYRLGRAAPLSDWLQAVAAQEFAARLAGCTLWWRLTPEGSQDALEIMRGLPDGPEFARLLTGSPR
ncbi:type VI secretion system-associated protein TagF [Ramlibacter monticola]|uniref:Type VI secretion system-associated protein TagF n=1 Tax=Ramlibacter monticola TaxID=1926872 RepID=A0A937CUN1_9BURK|nr:type VI secretion system-associated protein TagF [Ramlibacter monticola]MBL0392839.1 type VI secretion system-associated protein TagF [Ramlibacter monticola]